MKINFLINLFYKFGNQPKNGFNYFQIKNFTSSAKKQIDVDKILERAKKQQAQFEQYKKELDKKKTEKENEISENENSFMSIMLNKWRKIQRDNISIESRWGNQIWKIVNILPKDNKTDEIMDNFLQKSEHAQIKYDNSMKEHQEKHKDNVCVDSIKALASMEEKRFKSTRQTYQKAEEDLDKHLRSQNRLSLEEKNKYEEDRLKWNQGIIEDIRKSKIEKQEFNKELVSKLEKPSEIAQDLMDQFGPDTTGGDE